MYLQCHHNSEGEHNKLDCTLPDEFLEPILEHGLDALPELIRTVINAAMELERQQHLGAAPYERNDRRRGYANGYKPKTDGVTYLLQ